MSDLHIEWIPLAAHWEWFHLHLVFLPGLWALSIWIALLQLYNSNTCAWESWAWHRALKGQHEYVVPSGCMCQWHHRLLLTGISPKRCIFRRYLFYLQVNLIVSLPVGKSYKANVTNALIVRFYSHHFKIWYALFEKAYYIFSVFLMHWVKILCNMFSSLFTWENWPVT